MAFCPTRERLSDERFTMCKGCLRSTESKNCDSLPQGNAKLSTCGNWAKSGKCLPHILAPHNRHTQDTHRLHRISPQNEPTESLHKGHTQHGEKRHGNRFTS